MRGTNKVWQDSTVENMSVTDDALKGLLRDKSGADAERHIRIVRRKIMCVENAMTRLVENQRASAKLAECDCMDLYLATNQRIKKIKVDNNNCDSTTERMTDNLTLSYVLEWRAKSSFATQHGLSKTARLHPFDTNHKTYFLVYEYINQVSPGYYKVLAAYETARLTLNYTLKALRKIAIDVHRLRVEAEGLPTELFNKEIAKLGRHFISSVDKSGELTWILQGLYFEM